LVQRQIRAKRQIRWDESLFRDPQVQGGSKVFGCRVLYLYDTQGGAVIILLEF